MKIDRDTYENMEIHHENFNKHLDDIAEKFNIELQALQEKGNPAQQTPDVIVPDVLTFGFNEVAPEARSDIVVSLLKLEDEESQEEAQEEDQETQYDYGDDIKVPDEDQLMSIHLNSITEESVKTMNSNTTLPSYGNEAGIRKDRKEQFSKNMQRLHPPKKTRQTVEKTEKEEKTIFPDKQRGGIDVKIMQMKKALILLALLITMLVIVTSGDFIVSTTQPDRRVSIYTPIIGQSSPINYVII